MDMKSFNPLNLLEKLINEHGSAAIRGDQIALLRDQLIATTNRLAELEAENAKLQSENVNLQDDKDALNQRIDELETRLKELEHLTLSEDHLRILEFISTHDLAIDTDIANSIGLPLLTVQHHIDELHKNKCVSSDFRQNIADMAAGRQTPSRWSIEPRGRSTLFEHQQQ